MDFFNKFKNSENKYYLIIILFCIILLLPIVLVGNYDRPSIDDYDYSILTHETLENGGNLFDLIKVAVKTDIKFYNSWQGLYSSAFILSLQPAIFGDKFYALTCILILSISFFCLYFSIKILNKHFIKETNFFVLTTSFVILTILALLLPSATEGLFWFNGAMNYMPWAFTNFLGICLLIELFYAEKYTKKYFILLIFSTILSFFTSGGNHVTAFANILFMSMGTIILTLKKRYYSILPLSFAIFGFIIMYIAPGTAIRQTFFINPSIIDTITSTYNFTKNIIMDWMNFKWLLSLIILTPIVSKISKEIKYKINVFVPIVSVCYSIMVICAMFAIPYYAMGTFGYGRLTNVVWITFIILTWVNYTLIISILEKNQIITLNLNNNNLKKWFTIVAIISLFLIFYMPQNHVCSNSYVCLHELKNGDAKKFANEMDERLELINSPNLKEVKLKKLTPGSILYYHDLTNDSNNWGNLPIEKYYNKTIYIADNENT